MLMTGKSKDIIRSTLKCQLKADSLFQETAFFFQIAALISWF